MAYMGLEPKSSHTTKYFQSFELVLFHVIHVSIKCHKSSHYPHLLNNYLLNYLNFLGLTVGPMSIFVFLLSFIFWMCIYFWWMCSFPMKLNCLINCLYVSYVLLSCTNSSTTCSLFLSFCTFTTQAVRHSHIEWEST